MGGYWNNGNKRRTDPWANIIVLVGSAIILLFITLSLARSQGHQHPPHDVAIHEQFYSTWRMPDQPEKSCCNKTDCYPTEARWESGHWQAKRREDGKWLFIPWEKVEQNRDSPDGRNHLCAPPPTATAYKPDTVFCFILGSGT